MSNKKEKEREERIANANLTAAYRIASSVMKNSGADIAYGGVEYVMKMRDEVKRLQSEPVTFPSSRDGSKPLWEKQLDKLKELKRAYPCVPNIPNPYRPELQQRLKDIYRY